MHTYFGEGFIKQNQEKKELSYTCGSQGSSLCAWGSWAEQNDGG